MFLKNSVKPLELVVSAIHCLKEKNGSSPQNILRFLVGNYNVDPETLKPHVQTGLKRGIGFGMITQKSGLYRLNDALGDPPVLPLDKLKKPQKIKLRKGKKPVKRRKIRPVVMKKGKRRIFKQPSHAPKKSRRKTKKVKEKRLTKVGGTPRRLQSDLRKRKQKRSKVKRRKLRQRPEKGKKVTNEMQQSKPENDEIQKSETAKEGEAAFTNVKM